MTRINVGIDPRELQSKHLLAEHRELKRIPNTIKNGKAKLIGISPEFKLGTGHVKFFYNKLGYLQRRYLSIFEECINREFDVTDFSDAFVDCPPNLFGDYEPTLKDRSLLVERITERGGLKVNSNKLPENKI